MISVFKEHFSRISSFLLFSECKGLDLSAGEESLSEDQKKVEVPPLSYLRMELDRLRPGMSDYIIRVSTPLIEGVDGSNTVISIRGGKSLAKFETVKKLAKVIGKEMLTRGDETHDWESLDTDHLADLLAGSLKFFSVTMNLDKMQFTTEALK